MIDRYAVLGNPVAHSKSPRIHTLFASQTDQQLQYEAIRVESGKLADAVGDFQTRGGKGLNITVPLKEEAWMLANTRSERAERAGAVNTLVLNQSGEHFGDNTDGTGLLRDLLHNHDITLQNKRLLLVGAGGAARGVIEPLLLEKPSLLVPIAPRRRQSHSPGCFATWAIPRVAGWMILPVKASTSSSMRRLPASPDRCLHYRTMS